MTKGIWALEAGVAKMRNGQCPQPPTSAKALIVILAGACTVADENMRLQLSDSPTLRVPQSLEIYLTIPLP
jgi:CBS-domain-containing membrane protein